VHAACSRAPHERMSRGIACIATCALLFFGLPTGAGALEAAPRPAPHFPGAVPRASPRAPAARPPDRRARDAFELPPDGCALGIGGPALDPARSLRAARDDAVAALAAARLGVDLESEVGWVGARIRERSSERAEGVLRGVWIAALRARPDGGIDVVACGADATREASPQTPRGDRWPPGFLRRPGCGLGIAGPGPASGDRSRLAWRDAREMLARSVEARIVHALALEGGIGLRRSHAVQATPRGQRRADEAEASLQRRSWLDRGGRGPLGRPGLLYAQLCLPDGAVEAPAPAVRPGLAHPGSDS